jgi:PTS system nitrogen regulatory IIA component
MSENNLMDIKQVAAYLQINEATAYSWAQKGKLPGIKLGRMWRFRREDIETWLDQNMHGPKPEGQQCQEASQLERTQ